MVEGCPDSNGMGARYSQSTRPQAIKEAITHFLEAKQRAGRRPVYLKNLSYTLHIFGRHFGDRLVNDVTHDEIEAFVLSLPLSLRSQAHYYADLSNGCAT